MRPAASGLDRVLAGQHSYRWTGRVLNEWDQKRGETVEIIDRRFSFTSTSDISGNGSATLALTDVHGRSKAPLTVEDFLSPYGNWLEVTCHVHAGSYQSSTVLGKFEISSPQPGATSAVTIGGASRTTAETIQVRLDDAFLGTKAEPIHGVQQAPQGASVLAELESLLGLPVTADDDATIDVAFEYPEDRLKAAFDLVQLVGGTPYMRWDGTVGIRPNAWPAPLLTLRDGPTGLLAEVVPDEWDSKDVVNEVLVETEDVDGVVIRSRPLRIEEGAMRYGLRKDGAWGRRSKLYKVDSLHTQAQVDAYAAERFAADTTPKAVGVSFRMPIDPRLEPGDVIRLQTTTVSGLARLKTVDIDSSPTMKVSAYLG